MKISSMTYYAGSSKTSITFYGDGSSLTVTLADEQKRQVEALLQSFLPQAVEQAKTALDEGLAEMLAIEHSPPSDDSDIPF